VLNEEKSNPVISALELESAVYEPVPTRDEYLKAIEPSEDTALDKTVTTKARTEQAYLRNINFKQSKYVDCGICHREFPVTFLVAAHIKKRSDCSDEERRDYNHISMPMCKFGCDELYEKGYIGVDKNVFVIKDENLSSTVLEHLSSVDGNECNHWNSNTVDYFKWHNDRMKLVG